MNTKAIRQLADVTLDKYRIYQKIPRTGYICPHCESRLRAGETLPNIQASQKARPQRTKGATP